MFIPHLNLFQLVVAELILYGLTRFYLKVQYECVSASLCFMLVRADILARKGDVARLLRDMHSGFLELLTEAYLGSMAVPSHPFP